MLKKKYKVLTFILAFTLILSALSACNSDPADKVGASELKSFSSYSQLTKLIQKNISAGSNLYGMWRAVAGGEKAAQDMAEGDTEQSGNNTSGKSDDYSTTNLQVEGVDEADIVKTDGEYLYIISNGRFIIADVRDPANIQIVSELKYYDINNYQNNRNVPVELFLDTEKKIASLVLYTYDGRLMEAFAGEPAEKDTAEPGVAVDGDMRYYGGYYGEQNVMVQVFDVSDPEKPVMKREFSQEGSIVSSRRVGDFIYLVTNKYIYFYTDESGKTQDELVIPAVKDSASKNVWEMLPVDSILAIEDAQYSNFIVVTAIDTSSDAKSVSAKAILGGGQSIYASASDIYVASSRYTYDESKMDVTVNEAGDTVVEKAAEGSDTVSPDSTISSDIKPADEDVEWEIFAPPAYEVFTDIYRFSAEGGKIDFDTAGVVPGYILNQFAMDEYKGYFRIATTTGETWRTDEFTSMNNVYVLDNALKVKGKIEGLASTETIKSIRFLGDKAYMVTFRTTDPLFVLDLSDPSKPEVKGELKIPGYSEYLHPVSENILLGFGRDAVEENDQAIEKGFKVSVFDVSDINAPKEISTMIIGDRGTYSDVSYNHKALLFSAEKNIIGFPITIYEVPESQDQDNWAYGIPTFSGYMILGLTGENKLIEKARISHIEFEVPAGYPYDGELKDEEWEEFNKIYNYSYLYSVKRGAFIGSTLFTVSDYIIKANSLDDFSNIGDVKLPGFNELYEQYFGKATESRG